MIVSEEEGRYRYEKGNQEFSRYWALAVGLAIVAVGLAEGTNDSYSDLLRRVILGARLDRAGGISFLSPSIGSVLAGPGFSPVKRDSKARRSPSGTIHPRRGDLGPGSLTAQQRLWQGLDQVAVELADDLPGSLITLIHIRSDQIVRGLIAGHPVVEVFVRSCSKTAYELRAVVGLAGQLGHLYTPALQIQTFLSYQ